MGKQLPKEKCWPTVKRITGKEKEEERVKQAHKTLHITHCWAQCARLAVNGPGTRQRPTEQQVATCHVLRSCKTLSSHLIFNCYLYNVNFYNVNKKKSAYYFFKKITITVIKYFYLQIESKFHIFYQIFSQPIFF